MSIGFIYLCTLLACPDVFEEKLALFWPTTNTVYSILPSPDDAQNHHITLQNQTMSLFFNAEGDL